MHVVIATDGHAAALHAMEEALRLLSLRAPGTRVTLVSVSDPELRVGSNDDAEADLASARAMMERAGVTCATVMRSGKFVHEILAAGHDLAADLIVLGTERRSKLTRALLGSVAADVMAKWDGAVLIVKHHE